MEQRQETVLLIDDDMFFLTVLSDAFTQSGFKVIKANNGADGVKLFAQHRPPVVISDLIMPDMGGAYIGLGREPWPNYPRSPLSLASIGRPESQKAGGSRWPSRHPSLIGSPPLTPSPAPDT